ncbi:MAG: glycoside hydrolase family 9 protein [Candidatus Aminicenantes bacterium]|nr:MAG: glycoside hydrolase family 9 protein [Candidatus Aminicenantes bacterium]
MIKTPGFLILLMCLLIFPAVLAGNIKILTNHIGYETSGPKHAVVQGYKENNITTFKVKEYQTGKEVLSGPVKKTGRVQNWKEWHYWSIDFDEVTIEGMFYIECLTSKGTVRSFPFRIQNNILERHALSDVIFYFKGQRCTGLLNKADGNMTFSEGEEGTVDVHGGWYDASGDYGKHLSHLSFSSYFNPQQTPLTVWSLFKTYEALEKRGDPDFNQFKRRLLDEAMYGADYLVRVKKPRGSFYRTVSGIGPGKRPGDRRITPAMKGFRIKEKKPEESDLLKENKKEEMPAASHTYEVGYRAGGGLSIAALAIASTYDVSGEFKNADYLKAAEDAFAYLEKNNLNFTNDGKENIVDDYCALTASVELYKATGKMKYRTAADRRASSLMNRLISGGGYNNYWRADDGDRPFFHASDAGFPVVSLLLYLGVADEKTKNRVLVTVKKSLLFELEVTQEVANPFGYSRQLVRSKDGRRRTSFFFPHDTETAPWWQGENARLGSMAAAARMTARYFKQDTDFYEKLQVFSQDQLNWILGLNPFDTCMLHGSGRNNPEYMFFGSYQYTNAPGGICNGITAGLDGDEDIDFNLPHSVTGKDNDWRWGEQWLPHASWFLIAISIIG